MGVYYKITFLLNSGLVGGCGPSPKELHPKKKGPSPQENVNQNWVEQ